jgi:ribosome maturation factor RimP
LGNVLTVEHEIDYDRLEVSSAGLDRVLKKEKDFVRFDGERAQIKLRIGIKEQGEHVAETALPRKTFLGVLKGVSDGRVLMEYQDHIYEFDMPNIDKARLSPQF